MYFRQCSVDGVKYVSKDGEIQLLNEDNNNKAVAVSPWPVSVIGKEMEDCTVSFLCVTGMKKGRLEISYSICLKPSSSLHTDCTGGLLGNLSAVPHCASHREVQGKGRSDSDIR